MRVDIFQAVAIAYRGNSFLRGECGDKAPELMGPTDLFRHVQELAFNRGGGLAVQNGCLALGTKSFFLRLAREGVDEFRLALDLCRRGPLCNEPSGWGIIASSDHGTELWQPIWKGVLVRYDQPSAYRVSYESARHSPWAARRPEGIETSLGRMRSLMHETLQACIDMNRAPLFDQVKGAWNGDGPGAKIAEDILGSSATEGTLELTKMAVQCVLLVETAEWLKAVETQESLEHATDKLWSAAMRSFESICAAPSGCSSQTLPSPAPASGP
jgi:hypothetical protein